MQEPLRQQDPEELPEDESTDLEGIEGGGESTARETGHLQALPSQIPEDSAEPGSDPSGIHGIKGEGETTPRRTGHLQDASALSGNQINAAERAAGTGGKGILPGAEQGLVRGGLGALGPKEEPKGVLGLASRMFQSKRARNGGLIGGGVVGIAILLITTFAPVLRLDHLFQNINNRAFAAAGDAVEHRMEYLFQRYILLQVTNLNSCKAVVSTDCRADYSKEGIAANLFNAWRDARVEDKIFAKMGLTVESTRNPDRKAGVHRFTLRDRGGKEITFANEGDWDRFVEGQFTGGRREFGREMRKALRDNTFNLNIMQRKQVRKYLERKHNVKLWCFLACKTKDSVEDKFSDSKTKLKYKFVERFIYPFSVKYATIMNCLISGDLTNKCSPEKLREQGLDRDAISDEELTKITERLKDAEKQGNLKLSSIIIEDLLAKVLGRAGARTLISAVPLAGQIYLGLLVIDTLNEADQFVEDHGFSRIAADINARQYIEFYQANRSDSDALKRGKLSLEDTGALVEQFNGAEKSCVYKAYNDNPAYNNVALFSPTAFAASSCNDDESYKCANGKPIPEGEQVCEEKKIARVYQIEEIRNNVFVDGIVDTLNIYDACLTPDIPGVGCARISGPGHKAITTIGDITDAVAGPVVDGIIWTLRNAPLIGDTVGTVLDFAKDKFSELVQAFMSDVFPLPIQIDSPPREKYDGLEGGAALAASEFGQGGYTDEGDYGQGAPKVSKEDFVAIQQDYFDQQDYEFKTSSFVNRIANTDEPNSLISKMAMAVPSGVSTMFFSVISSPSGLLESLANLPGTIFGSSASAAESSAQRQISINPFKVSFHAWPLDDPAITAEPGKYTEEYCQKIKEKRQESAYENEITGFIEYPISDPCLLETTTVDSGCTMFVQGSGCLEGESEDAGGSEEASVTVDPDDLYKPSEDIACAPGTKDLGIQDGYHNYEKVKIRVCAVLSVPETGDVSTVPGANGKLVVNSVVSAAVVKMFKDAKDAGAGPLAASEGFRTMARQEELEACAPGCTDGNPVAPPGTSNHQMGIAIDISDGTALNAWMIDNGKDYGFVWYGPGDSVHFSPDGS